MKTESRPLIEEQFADNGGHSHYHLIDTDTGEILWSSFPEETIARGRKIKGYTNSKESIFNDIKKDLLRGTLQQRLGYDLYDKVFNKRFDQLNPKEQEAFDVFLKKEGYSISA